MSCDRCSPYENRSAEKTRRTSFLGVVTQLLIAYALTVFLSGTLIHTGHPVAVETGRLLQTVTFVEPAQNWSAEHGLKPVSYALNFLSKGVDFSRLT